MIKKSVILTSVFILIFSINLSSEEWKTLPRPKPAENPESNMELSLKLHEADMTAEEMHLPEVKIAPESKILDKIRNSRSITQLDLPLADFSQQSNAVFAPPYFSRTGDGRLIMKPNESQPANTFGFWQSPSFTIVKPESYSDYNTAKLIVEMSYSAIPSGYTMPSLRLRINRSDDRKVAFFLLDGRALKPEGGQYTATCTYNLNDMTQTEEDYTASIDMIALGGTVDPETVFLISKVYLVRTDAAETSDYLVEGAWVEDDNDLKAWINDQRVHVNADQRDVYDAAYNDHILSYIVIYSSFQEEFDLWTWVENERIFVNEGDTFQTCVAGDYIVYLEVDGDVKVWNAMTGGDIVRIKDNGYRISSGGDDSVLIWDQDDDLYVWHPDFQGVYRIDDSDILALCKSASIPLQ